LTVHRTHTWPERALDGSLHYPGHVIHVLIYTSCKTIQNIHYIVQAITLAINLVSRFIYGLRMELTAPCSTRIMYLDSDLHVMRHDTGRVATRV
jgi:hypothetical protein